MKRVLLVVLCALALMVSATPTLAQHVRVLSGQTGSNAHYRIEVPPVWNGDLVIWNHGFDLNPPGPVDHGDLGPLADLQLAQGYAVAASSYRLDGWALFATNTDLKNLYDIFRRQVGTPSQVILTGGSLGGIVTIQAVEEGNLGNVAGALTICGAVGGSRNWDGALDIRLVYDAICGEVPGAAIPGGAEGLPAGSTFTPANLGAAINACFSPTPQGLQRLGRFLAVTRIPSNFIGTDMGYVTFAMSNLVHDPHKLAGKVGTGNEGVDYGDPAIDAAIARVTPNPGAANRLGAFYTPTGDTRGARIVSLHTDKDGLVLVENESEYASRTDPAFFTAAVVVESTPTHCGFTPAETLSAWESLRAWLAGAPQPTPTSMQMTCSAIAGLGLAPGPCRIDPTYVIPDMDLRIRPRQD
jgi:hypothetical protein